MPEVPLIVIFGEDTNDREALKELVQALYPQRTRIKPLRKPLVLVRDRDLSAVRGTSDRVSAALAAVSGGERIALVVVHQDCDACEPSHQMLSEKIETGLSSCGAPVIAAAPAWEIEAWWYLWPDAVATVSPKWRRLKRTGTQIGMLRNIKEVLRRELRPSDRSIRVRDYVESDSIAIARAVRELNLVDTRNAQSRSFDTFAMKIRAVLQPQ